MFIFFIFILSLHAKRKLTNRSLLPCHKIDDLRLTCIVQDDPDLLNQHLLRPTHQSITLHRSDDGKYRNNINDKRILLEINSDITQFTRVLKNDEDNDYDVLEGLVLLRKGRSLDYYEDIINSDVFGQRRDCSEGCPPTFQSCYDGLESRLEQVRVLVLYQQAIVDKLGSEKDAQQKITGIVHDANVTLTRQLGLHLTVEYVMPAVIAQAKFPKIIPEGSVNPASWTTALQEALGCNDASMNGKVGNPDFHALSGFRADHFAFSILFATEVEEIHDFPAGTAPSPFCHCKGIVVKLDDDSDRPSFVNLLHQVGHIFGAQDGQYVMTKEGAIDTAVDGEYVYDSAQESVICNNLKEWVLIPNFSQEKCISPYHEGFADDMKVGFGSLAYIVIIAGSLFLIFIFACVCCFCFCHQKKKLEEQTVKVEELKVECDRMKVEEQEITTKCEAGVAKLQRMNKKADEHLEDSNDKTNQLQQHKTTYVTKTKSGQVFGPVAHKSDKSESNNASRTRTVNNSSRAGGTSIQNTSVQDFKSNVSESVNDQNDGMILHDVSSNEEEQSASELQSASPVPSVNEEESVEQNEESDGSDQSQSVTITSTPNVKGKGGKKGKGSDNNKGKGKGKGKK